MPTAPARHDTGTGAERHSTESIDDKKRQDRRQYRTNSTTWRKIRAHQLAIEPLCRICGGEGITKVANTVDHIDGDSWNNKNNFQSLCEPCHNRKTALEDGGFGR